MKAANYAFQGAYLFDPDKLRNPSYPDPVLVASNQQVCSTGARGMVADAAAGYRFRIRQEEPDPNLQGMVSRIR